MTRNELAKKLEGLGFFRNAGKDYNGYKVYDRDVSVGIPESEDSMDCFQVWDVEGSFLLEEFTNVEGLLDYLGEDPEKDVTPQDIENALAPILECGDIEGVEISGVETFQEAGVLTQANGLVLRLADGSEFQLTIVKSR